MRNTVRNKSMYRRKKIKVTKIIEKNTHEK